MCCQLPASGVGTVFSNRLLSRLNLTRFGLGFIIIIFSVWRPHFRRSEMTTALATIHPIGRFDFKNFGEGAVRFSGGTKWCGSTAQSGSKPRSTASKIWKWISVNKFNKSFFSISFVDSFFENDSRDGCFDDGITRYLKVTAIPQTGMDPLNW